MPRNYTSYRLGWDGCACINTAELQTKIKMQLMKVRFQSKSLISLGNLVVKLKLQHSITVKQLTFPDGKLTIGNSDIGLMTVFS